MKKNFLFGVLASAAMMLMTSCMDGGGEAEGMVDCFCTVQTSTGQTVLHVDGGGTIYPTEESVYSATNGKGFGKIRRIRAIVSYPESGFSKNQDGSIVIRNARFQGIQDIAEHNILTVMDAQDQNLLAKDSLQDLASLNKLYAYDGWLTVVYSTRYYIRSDMSSGVRPTMNLMVEPDEKLNSEYNGTFLLNLHPLGDSTKESLQQNPTVLINSYDLSNIFYEYNIPPTGVDSLVLNLQVQGIKDKVSIKVSPKDMVHKY